MNIMISLFIIGIILFLNKIRKDKFLKYSILSLIFIYLYYNEYLNIFKNTTYLKLFELNSINKDYVNFKDNFKNLRVKYHPDRYQNENISIVLHKIMEHAVKEPYKSHMRYKSLLMNYHFTNNFEYSLENEFDIIDEFRHIIWFFSEYIFYIFLFLIILLSGIKYKIIFITISIPIFVLLFLLKYEYFFENKITFYYELIEEVDILNSLTIFQIKNLLYILQITIWTVYLIFYKLEEKDIKCSEEEYNELKDNKKNLIEFLKIEENLKNNNSLQDLYFKYEKKYYNFIDHYDLGKISKAQLFIDLFYIILNSFNVYRLIFK